MKLFMPRNFVSFVGDKIEQLYGSTRANQRNSLLLISCNNQDWLGHKPQKTTLTTTVTRLQILTPITECFCDVMWCSSSSVPYSFSILRIQQRWPHFLNKYLLRQKNYLWWGVCNSQSGKSPNNDVSSTPSHSFQFFHSVLLLLLPTSFQFIFTHSQINLSSYLSVPMHSIVN